MAAKDNLEKQLRDVEGSYRRLVTEIEQQLNDLEERTANALDGVQGQLPDEVAEVMARVREMTLATRRRLWSLSEQALEATRDAVEVLAETTSRFASRPGLKRAPAKPKRAAQKAAKKKTKKATKKTAKRPAKKAAKKKAKQPAKKAAKKR